MMLRILFIVASLVVANRVTAANDAVVVFEYTVLPIVAARCGECHSQLRRLTRSEYAHTILDLFWLPARCPAVPARRWPGGRPTWFKKVDVRGQFMSEIEATIRRIGPLFLRRDLPAAEVAALMQQVSDRYDASEESVNPVKVAFLDGMTAVMMSPNFLCLVEHPGMLDIFAFASRLAAARSGSLKNPQALREQTDRMLADPRAQRFVTGFTDQRLGIWGIDSTTPDKNLYPEYTELLRYSSLEENTGRYREKYRVLDHEVAKLPPQQRKGRQRWKDGLPVDAAGITPDGKRFAGIGELRAVLAEDPAQLAKALGYGLRSVVHGVVQSDTFRSK